MKAFEIAVNGQKLDYRTPAAVDLKVIADEFQTKFTLENLRQQSRHVIGETEINGRPAIFKLATTPGISFLTEIEANWNKQFNQLHPREEVDFWVPENLESGRTDNEMFYLVTDRFEGEMLVSGPDQVEDDISESQFEKIISLAEMIQYTPLEFAGTPVDHQLFFKQKVDSWYEAVPQSVRSEYQIERLVKEVEKNLHILGRSSRHGDYAPWHIFNLAGDKLGLIDGEHAMAEGVEYYDLCFMIQRIFSINASPTLAIQLLEMLKSRGYNPGKLKTVLAGRAVGGYLDESFKPNPDYTLCQRLQNLVIDMAE